MKLKILCSSVTIAALLFFAGCKKGTGVNYQSPQVIKTEKGTAIGAPDRMMIGAAGGVFTSTDGRVTITVPQDAVAAATQFTIQPITNTLYSNDASRIAYRLLPEGSSFLKPVEVQLKYDEHDTKTTVPEYMTVAWQQTDGSWKVEPARLNKTTKTLKFETTHFSDWTVTGGFELKIEKEVVRINETSKLWVVSITDDELLAQLGVTAEDDAVLTALGNWKIILGPGSITENKGGSKGFAYSATYTAPSSVNGVQHVTISMEVEGFNKIKDPSAPGGIRNTGQMILFGRLIVGDNFMTGTLDGVEFGFFGDKVSAIGMNGAIVIRGSDGSGEVTLSANANGAGSYPCGQIIQPGKAGVIIGSPAGAWPSYGHSYIECGQVGEVKYSPASFEITRWPAVGQVAEGSFNGPVYLSDGNCGPRQKMLYVQFSITRGN
jgi:hypothetical protein